MQAYWDKRAGNMLFYFTLPQLAEPKLFQLYEFKILSPTRIWKTSRKKKFLN